MEGNVIDDDDITEMIAKVTREGEKLSFSDFMDILKKETELENDDIVDLILNDYDM